MSAPDEDESNVNLTPLALKPKAGSPWGDDALQRQGIASDLNTLVADFAQGEDSATIALDGVYGTGKTFVLERWVQELQDQGRGAVYYNAWENDCDDDPLVSLVETLASGAKTGWAEWYEASKAALESVLYDIVRKHTGVDGRNIGNALTDVGLLDAAAARRTSRRKLKELLAKLVEAARDQEDSGVVLVIDELDRCRPTFAIELMERVKHVLNVPGLVFVFGVNVAALRETVKVVYGNIDADQYLLRMFNAPLHMPSGATFQGKGGEERALRYVKNLVDRRGLRAFCKRSQVLDSELAQSEILLALLASISDATPREIEQVVWLLAKIASSSLQPNGPAYSMFPLVLVPLVVARVRAPDAYYRAVSIPDQAPAVINCLLELIDESSLEVSQQTRLDFMEMTMYRICHQHPPDDHNSQPPAYVSLQEYAPAESQSALDGRHLSRRLNNITKERASALLRLAPPQLLNEQVGNVLLQLNLTFATLRSITSRFDAIWPRT